MTIKDLFNLAIVNGWEDAEIVINYECDDSWYNLESVPIKEEILYYDKISDKIYITL